ncbi:MAG: hypothetical protein ACRDZR_10505 [Acidimicrobiales bacterium]
MIRRPLWLGVGVVVGVGGTLWAERRVRRAVERLVPESVAEEAGRSVRRLGDRVQAAVAAGREARDRREEELWSELDRRLPDASQIPARSPGRPRPAAPAHAARSGRLRGNA